MNGAVAPRSVIRVTRATYIRGNNLICRIASTQWPRVCTEELESPESTEDTQERYPATTTDNDLTTAHERRRRRLSRVYRRGNAIRAWIGPRYAGTVAVIIRQMEMLLNRGSFAYVKTALAGAVARHVVPATTIPPACSSRRLRRKREVARVKSGRWTSRGGIHVGLQQIMLIVRLRIPFALRFHGIYIYVTLFL